MLTYKQSTEDFEQQIIDAQNNSNYEETLEKYEELQSSYNDLGELYDQKIDEINDLNNIISEYETNNQTYDIVQQDVVKIGINNIYDSTSDKYILKLYQYPDDKPHDVILGIDRIETIKLDVWNYLSNICQNALNNDTAVFIVTNWNKDAIHSKEYDAICSVISDIQNSYDNVYVRSL